MVCKHGQMPKRIPNEISELLFEDFNLDMLNEDQQKNGSMIRKLDIWANQGTRITSESFQQFSNLIYLGLHGKVLRVIDQEAFYGLKFLQTLNLSSNPLLVFSYISRALNADSTSVLTSLTSLSVSKVQMSVAITVSLDEYFFKSVSSGRRLKHLDISNINIAMLNFSHLEPLCKSLESLDLQNSVIGRTDDIRAVKACTSLKTVDASKLVVPALRFNFTFQTINFSCGLLNFLFHTETLIIKDVNSAYHVRQSDYFLNMSICPLHIRKVSVAGNMITWVNMTVALHHTTKQSLSELNVSYNGLEYLAPSAMKPSGNIHILDLSNNELNVMQKTYKEDFEKLFWSQTKLQFLYLSHNGLEKIPIKTFSKNKMLKVLDLSYNNIKALNFAIKQFVKLDKLIVSHNKILYIEQKIQMELQTLLMRSSDKNSDGNDTFHLYLEGNQFLCTCEEVNLKFIKWLTTTEVISKNELLKCNLEEDIFVVRGGDLTDTEHFCRIKTIKQIVLITTPILSAFIITGMIIAFLMKKRRARKLMIREVIAQIKTGTYPLQHLVFLSHCSEDTDIVMDKLYPGLCKHLSEMTHSNESLVCIGDRHFRPGFPLHEEVIRCVADSSVFVAVISRNFCLKPWCNLEIGEAYDQKKPIIMIMIEKVEKGLMDNFLLKIFDRYTHASWKPDDNGGHIEPEWTLFCKSVIQLAGKSTQADKYEIHA